MIKTYEREKLVNAVVFFAKNTKHCGKTKLFKLLYLLDFTHFQEIGRAVTGLRYRAWEMGPVPHALWREWPALESGHASTDLAAAIGIKLEKVHDRELHKVLPRVDFDPSHFTKRELRTMESLAQRFREERTRPLIDYTHESLGPWEKTWRDGLGNDEEIDYELSLDGLPQRQAVEASADEYTLLIKRLGSHDAAATG